MGQLMTEPTWAQTMTTIREDHLQCCKRYGAADQTYQTAGPMQGSQD